MGGWSNPIQTLSQGLVLTFDGRLTLSLTKIQSLSFQKVNYFCTALHRSEFIYFHTVLASLTVVVVIFAGF